MTDSLDRRHGLSRRRLFTIGGATAVGVAGTANPSPAEPESAPLVWSRGPGCFTGGATMVVRRIAMRLDTWDGYRLAYRVVADDGHPNTGSIGFTVGDTTVPPPPRPSPAPASQPGLLSPERFGTDRSLPWVLAGTGVLVVAGFAYLLTRRRHDP